MESQLKYNLVVYHGLFRKEYKNGAHISSVNESIISCNLSGDSIFEGLTDLEFKKSVDFNCGVGSYVVYDLINQEAKQNQKLGNDVGSISCKEAS